MNKNRFNGLDRLLTNEEMDEEIINLENGEPSLLDAVIRTQEQQQIKAANKYRFTPAWLAEFLKKTGCN